jgi:hypothetical protein
MLIGRAEVERYSVRIRKVGGSRGVLEARGGMAGEDEWRARGVSLR